MLVLVLQLKTSFMRFKLSKQVGLTTLQIDESSAEIIQMLLISNVLSLFQISNAFTVKMLELNWLKSKKKLHQDETLFTTGFYKPLIASSLLVVIQPYWFLYGETYRDYYNEHSADLHFQINDVLLVLQIFFKMIPAYIYIIELTQWTDPKAQRCCQIFGVNANF